MKYFEVNTRTMISIDDERTRIAPAPDEEEIDCLTIGDDVYLPFVGWMKYNGAENTWVELEQDEEEELIGMFTEECTFTEIPESEIERSNGEE